MMLRLAMTLALAVPVAALAQVVPASDTATGEVRVEIVARGEIEAPPASITATAMLWERGDTQAAADTARDLALARVTKAAADVGVKAPAVFRPMSPSPIVPAPPAPPIVVRADGPQPRPVPPPKREMVSSATLTFTVGDARQFEALRAALAPLRVQLTNERAVPSDDPELRRRAKANALANSREEAAAYARALGLRVVRLISVSEVNKNLVPDFERMVANNMRNTQDLTKVTTSATLTVEYALAR